MTDVYKILYACVADGKKIANEVGDQNFKSLVKVVLDRLVWESRKSYLHKEKYTINYISSIDRVWMCISQKELNTRISFAYLENIQNRSLVSNSIDPSLSNYMKITLEKYNSSKDVSQQIQKEISSIRDVMLNNVNVLLQRGEKLEDLEARSEDLRENATLFKTQSTNLKKQFIYANLLWILLAIGVFLLIVLLILLALWLTNIIHF